MQTKWTKNTDKLGIHLVWFSSTVWRGQFALEFFAQNIWKENVTKHLCYFHKFWVEDDLHEHYCAFDQFCVVSGFFFAWLWFIFFIIKRGPLVGETLIEIESAVAKQKRKYDFVCFKTFGLRQFFSTIKVIFKNANLVLE